ncbi:MAG: transposase, partial [Shimia sp.]|nr:transposase [Shimia sp.]
SWQQALVIVQPATILRWHRELFRIIWRRKSKLKRPQPRIAIATILLIQRMARENQLWGAERIRGELLKLGIRVSKRTVQKYMRTVDRLRHTGQTWGTFLKNHADDIWVCDFLQTYDLAFRSLFVFVIIELGSRRVVHVAVTRSPSDYWVAQQLREATPWAEGPRYLIRDNDKKFGQRFSTVALASGIEEKRIAYRAPNMNAVCERFLGSLRRECLDHLLILGERHLRRKVQEYVAYFNAARPHQGIDQRIPDPPDQVVALDFSECEVVAEPVLG